MATTMPRSGDVVDYRLIAGGAPAVGIVHLALARTCHVVHLPSECQVEEASRLGSGVSPSFPMHPLARNCKPNTTLARFGGRSAVIVDSLMEGK